MVVINARHNFDDSFQVAHGITAWSLGVSARLLKPHTDSGMYMGRIIGETKYHTIQQVSDQSAVAHPKHLLNEVPRVGQGVRIQYSNEHGAVRDWQARQRVRDRGR